MDTRPMHTTLLCLAVATVLGHPGAAAAGEAPSAEPEPRWGPPGGGLSAAVEPVGPLRVQGPMRFRLLVRSAGGGAIRLPPAARAFAWLTVVQTFGDARETHYSARVPMPTEAWPKEISGSKALRLGPFSLAKAQAYPRKVARPLLTAYLKGEDENLPKAKGPLGHALKAGKAIVRFTLCLRYEGEKPVLVNTAATPVTLGPPDTAAMAPADRATFLDDLMKQFNRNPWAGQQAHETCVRLGKEVLPRVIEAAFETDRPGHARLWLATTLADIRDPRSVDALVRLLEDGAQAVRHVVAYHGPKQRSKRLDEAIVRAAAAGRSPELAAWTLLGFMVHRRTVPEKALKAGLESPDPKARGTAAEILARHASDENVARLTALLADPDPQVRGVAAKMLGQTKRAEPRVLGALVKALDARGETARQRICQALSTLTGKDMPYDPTAEASVRAARLAAWKAWWAEHRPGG